MTNKVQLTETRHGLQNTLLFLAACCAPATLETTHDTLRKEARLKDNTDIARTEDIQEIGATLECLVLVKLFIHTSSHSLRLLSIDPLKQLLD